LIIDIHKISNNNFEFPIYKVKEIDSTFRFKIYADKFMAYELVSIYKEVNKSIEEALLNESDLTLFLNQYNLLINGENEVLINSTFQGHGGKLTIRIGIIPPNLLKKIILKSILKIILYLSIIFTSVLLVFKVNFLLIFAIWGVLFLISFISEELSLLLSSVKEKNLYGKQ
jgi:hypothetical protein